MSALTPAQLTALHSDLTTNTNTVTIAGTTVAIDAAPQTMGAAYAIALWYSQLASPTFIVWRNDLTTQDINESVSWAEVIALTTNMLLAFEALKNQTLIDASVASIRAAFGDIFPVASAPNSNAGLLAVAKRSATYIEKLLASGTGTSGSPATLGYQGGLEATDILAAWAA